MKLIFRLAWRNIWRNRRRTLITLTSMVIAVLLSVVTRSMQKGAYRQMIENVVGSYTGHLQIQHPKYNDDKTLDNSFAADTGFIDSIRNMQDVKLVLPRLESFALAAGRQQSRGVLVVGIDPEGENRFNTLSDKVVKGRYLTQDDQGILIAAGLAKYLACAPGDSLVLMGLGYHGANAAALLPIRGIVHFASPELDKRFVYMTWGRARDVFSTGWRLTSLVVEPMTGRQPEKLAVDLARRLDSKKYVVLSWRTLLPELVQQINGDNAGGIIMLGILYMVVAFGIFGTVLMMTNERMREFGVVNSLGLSTTRLGVMAAIEIVIVALIAGIAGTVLSLPIVAWFHWHPVRLTGEAAQGMINFGIEPVMPFLLDWRIFATQALVVLILSCCTALFPFAALRKLNPVEAMRK